MYFLSAARVGQRKLPFVKNKKENRAGRRSGHCAWASVPPLSEWGGHRDGHSRAPPLSLWSRHHSGDLVREDGRERREDLDPCHHRRWRGGGRRRCSCPQLRTAAPTLSRMPLFSPLAIVRPRRWPSHAPVVGHCSRPQPSAATPALSRTSLAVTRHRWPLLPPLAGRHCSCLGCTPPSLAAAPALSHASLLPSPRAPIAGCCVPHR
jgi:hypothetical protein